MNAVINNIMQKNIIVASPLESVAQAACRMRKFKIGCLPVLKENKLVGIITSSDIRESHSNRLVADVMTRAIFTIDHQIPIWDAYSYLKKHNIEHLPVMKDGILAGIVTKSDLLLEMGKNIDSLTGLYTSHYIQYIGKKILREGKLLTVLFFDLNKFGDFNKTYGHKMGDKCILILSSILKSAVHSTDYLCRYGGDEFLVMTTRPINKASKWAEETIDKISQIFRENNFNVQISVGISSGHQRLAYEEQISAFLDNLINSASLASSKAKKTNRSIMVV